MVTHIAKSLKYNHILHMTYFYHLKWDLYLKNDTIATIDCIFSIATFIKINDFTASYVGKFHIRLGQVDSQFIVTAHIYF